MARVMEVSAYELLDPGRYPAVIDEIEDEEGNFGPQFKFKFALAGNHAGKQLHGWCSQKLSQKSKLYQWVVGITGHAPQPGTSFDIDSLVGRKVVLTVSVEQKKDGSGAEFNRISTVKGYVPAARPTQQQPQPAVAEWDDIEGAVPQHTQKQTPPPPAEEDGDFVDEIPGFGS